MVRKKCLTLIEKEIRLVLLILCTFIHEVLNPGIFFALKIFELNLKLNYILRKNKIHPFTAHMLIYHFMISLKQIFTVSHAMRMF